MRISLRKKRSMRTKTENTDENQNTNDNKTTDVNANGREEEGADTDDDDNDNDDDKDDTDQDDNDNNKGDTVNNNDNENDEEDEHAQEKEIKNHNEDENEQGDEEQKPEQYVVEELEQVNIIRAGGCSDGRFKMTVWAELKRRYNIWNELQNHSGWSGNQITGELLTSDTVWDAEKAENPKAKKLRHQPMRNCWELEEIFAGNTATGNYTFQGGNLREHFPGMWKEATPMALKKLAKKPALSLNLQSPMLSTAIANFRASQANSGSHIQSAVLTVIDTFKCKNGWTRAMVDKDLDLFEEEAMAEIFNGLENDLDYQEHWLRYQIS
ncbi:hypothetical protein HOY80DRAFT_1004935 [Tuber brumale]|nr:hypothetical protein HOY80DRAFT_1004935 [Tuber brumale]